MQGAEIDTAKAKEIINQLKKAGVFSINFNGGEPLIRPDFFNIVEHASLLGFDLHLNTNATLIDDEKAKRLSQFFPSVCTSVLSSEPEKHDRLVGCKGAFKRMQQGVEHLLEHGMKVEINTCTFKENYHELYDIAKLMGREGVHVFCVTRYIMTAPEGRKDLLSSEDTIEVLSALKKIQNDFPTYKEVKLPGPVPYCELPSKFTTQLQNWNTPCQVGYGMCRISPRGIVTPCPLSDDVIGNLEESSFPEIWNSQFWTKYESMSHLPSNCRTCEDIETCRGGCPGYDDCMVSSDYTPKTYKWETK